MTSLSSRFSDPDSGRPWHLIEAASLAAASDASIPFPAFTLLLAGDTSAIPGPELVDLCSKLLIRGARYVCCWGPGADRLETACDEAAVCLRPDDESVIMTTQHEGESLEEATWFALTTAWPSPGYEDGEQAVVLMSFGSDATAAQVRAYLAAGAPMPDED